MKKANDPKGNAGPDNARRPMVDLWIRAIRHLAEHMNISMDKAARLIAEEFIRAEQQEQKQKERGLPVEQFGEIPLDFDDKSTD